MKVTQRDIQYIMNEANNIMAEQRKQGTADINEGKFSEMNEAKLTANYIAETVRHLKALYGYIKNRESIKCLPYQWVEAASNELSAANKSLGATNKQYKALAKKMNGQNGIRPPRQMDENVAVDSVSAATKSEADVQINNAKSAVENGKKIAKAGKGAVRALAKSGKKLTKAGAKVGMKAVHALSNVGKNIAKANQPIGTSEAGKKASQFISKVAKKGAEALNGKNKSNTQQQNKNVNEGAKFRLTKRDIQYIMNEAKNIVAEERK